MKFLSLALGLLFSLVCSVSAQETPDQPNLPTPFPGVAEVIPRAAQVTEDAVKAESSLVLLRNLEPLKDEIEATRKRQAELMERISKLGTPAEWSFDRLLEIRGNLSGQMAGLKGILDTLSLKLTQADQIRQRWTDRETFWKKWQENLRASKVDVPKEAFSESLATCRRLKERANEVVAPLVAQQTDVNALQTSLLEVQAQIDNALSNLRKQTFKKTTHSFANPEFYRQFNSDLWTSLKNGINEVQKFKWEFLTEWAWLAILQVGLSLGLALFIRHHWRGTQATKEWHFIAIHPWATGIFVAIVSLSALYDNPPSLWRLGLSALVTLTAAILVSGLLKNSRKKFMVNLLAGLFILTQILHLIGFPAPLYRLYLTFLCLLGIPFLWTLAKRNLKVHEGKTDSFTLSLKIGAGVLLVALLAQVTGYNNLSSRLIVSSVSTVFLSLFVAMTIRLARGGILFLFTHPVVLRHPFFYRYGDDLTARLSNILQIFIYSYAGLYLLVVWALYDSAGQAWNALMAKSIQLGEIEVSLHMVVLVILVLYLSMTFSWLLRALLETQIFPHRDFDRGVRDAIKKLLHYSIVFIGFLFAMSLAGFELKNFAVLAGAFGIGIGFGLQNIVNNFVSGLILLFERPVRVGDVVIIEDQWSTVRKIGMRSTVVETLNKSEIIVPNSELISQKVTNWTLSSSMARIVIPVGVAYGSNVPKVLNLLREAALACKDVLEIPEPSPIFTSFGDSSLDFELRVWVSNIDRMMSNRSELLQLIDQRFREEDVEIPFPQRDLHLYMKDARKLQQVVTEEVPPTTAED